MGLGLKGWEQEDDAPIGVGKNKTSKSKSSKITTGSITSAGSTISTNASEFDSSYYQQQADASVLEGEVTENHHIDDVDDEVIDFSPGISKSNNNNTHEKNDDGSCAANSASNGPFKWFQFHKSVQKSSASVVSNHSSSSVSRENTSVDGKQSGTNENSMKIKEQREEIKVLKFKLNQREQCIQSLETGLTSHRSIILELQNEVENVQAELSDAKRTIIFYQQRRTWKEEEEEETVRSRKSETSVASTSNSTIGDDEDDVASRMPITTAAKERIMRHEAKSEHRRLLNDRKNRSSSRHRREDDESDNDNDYEERPSGREIAEFEEKARRARNRSVESGSRSYHTRSRAESRSTSHRERDARSAEHRRGHQQDSHLSSRRSKSVLSHNSERSKHSSVADVISRREEAHERKRGSRRKTPGRSSESCHTRSRTSSRLKEHQRQRAQSVGQRRKGSRSESSDRHQDPQDYRTKLKGSSSHRHHQEATKDEKGSDVESVGCSTINTKSSRGSAEDISSTHESSEEFQMKRVEDPPKRMRRRRSLSEDNVNDNATTTSADSNYSRLLKKSDSSRVCLDLREKKRQAKKKSMASKRNASPCNAPEKEDAEIISLEDEDNQKKPRRVSTDNISMVSNITMDSTMSENSKRITFRKRDSIIRHEDPVL